MGALAKFVNLPGISSGKYTVPDKSLKVVIPKDDGYIDFMGVRLYLASQTTLTQLPVSAIADKVIGKKDEDKAKLTSTDIFKSHIPNTVRDVYILGLIIAAGLTNMTDDTDKQVQHHINEVVIRKGKSATYAADIYRGKIAYTSIPVVDGAGVVGAQMANPQLVKLGNAIPFNRDDPAEFNITLFSLLWNNAEAAMGAVCTYTQSLVYQVICVAKEDVSDVSILSQIIGELTK